MGNQNSTLVDPSSAGSTLTNNYCQLLAYQQQHSVTSSDSGAHFETCAGIPTTDDLNHIQIQQMNSTTHTNMGQFMGHLSQEQNRAPSFYASSEIPMDQENFQQEISVTMPSLINMSQFRAHINSLYPSGSGSNSGPRASTEIPMDQVHVQQTSTAPRLTLRNVNQLMASGPNSGLRLRDEIPMDQVHFQQTNTAIMPWHKHYTAALDRLKFRR